MSPLNIFYPIRRWQLCCLLFFIAACNNPPAYDKLILTHEDSLTEAKRINQAWLQIDSAKRLINTGDLVTRTGNDFASETFRNMNLQDKTYSHCGIASIEHDTLFIYHSLGGEWNPDQKIRRDPIEVFGEPYSNRGIGIFRFQLTVGEIDSLVATVQKFHKAGIMFDMKFDLQTDDRMYCAEFVYKSFRSINPKLNFHISQLEQFPFIGVDDLFMHPLCKEQKRILYK